VLCLNSPYEFVVGLEKSHLEIVCVTKIPKFQKVSLWVAGYNCPVLENEEAKKLVANPHKFFKASFFRV